MKRLIVGGGLFAAIVAVMLGGMAWARLSRNRELLAGLPTPPTGVSASVAKLLADVSAKVTKEPLQADRWAELGYAYFANELPNEANVCLERADGMQPGNARWMHLLGVAALRNGKNAAALEHFRRAHKRLPNQTPSLGHLAALLIESGKADEAKALLAPVVTAGTTDARLVYLHAQLQMADDPKKAAKSAESVLKVMGNRRDVHELLANLYAKTGDAAGAKREARILELLPKSDRPAPWPDAVLGATAAQVRLPEVVAATALQLAYDDRPAEALRLLDGLVGADRQSPTAVAAQALADAQAGDLEGSLKRLTEPAVKDHPDAAFGRGVLLFVQDKYAEALVEFQAAAAKNPKFVAAHFQCGRCLAQLEKRDAEAIKAYEAALAVEPAHLATLRDLAAIQIRAGRKADALKRIADAELLAPDTPVLAELKRLAQAS